MKRRFSTALCIQIVIALATYGQGAGQIFNQNAAQRKYLLEQITALKVYENYLQQGYKIAKDGTGAISRIKGGDLGLHTVHFDSLSTVSTKVRNYTKVKEMIRLQRQIISAHQKVYPRIAGSGRFSIAELTDFNAAYGAILRQAAGDMEELQLVVTNGKLKMTDDARIGLIDRLYRDMQHCFSRSQSLNRQALALDAARSRQAKDQSNLKNLYGQ